jgi:hypothetical protein
VAAEFGACHEFKKDRMNYRIWRNLREVVLLGVGGELFGMLRNVDFFSEFRGVYSGEGVQSLNRCEGRHSG